MNKLYLSLFLLALTFGSAIAVVQINEQEMKILWRTWKTRYNRVYSESEEKERFGIFMNNYHKIASNNDRNSSLKLALNQFADLNDTDFKSIYASSIDTAETPKNVWSNETKDVADDDLTFPESVDWRNKSGVTPVKDQKQCGSCWAFAAVATLESLSLIKHNKTQILSEQHLIDCEKTDSNGCKSGNSYTAFDYVAENGISLETDYPYTAKDGVCKFDANKTVRINKGYNKISRYNVDALKAAVAQQPVAVSLEAASKVFHFYKGGVIKPEAGCGDDTNHAVLVVGYTKINGEEAFIMKNSWGKDWGNNGYFYVSTDKKANGGAGVCGILTKGRYPTA